MADEIRETIEERRARYQVEWEERRRKVEERHNKEHDRLLKDYGIETYHELAEINPDDHFEFEDEGYFLERKDLDDKTYVEIKREKIEGFTHMVQDKGWQPKLIEGFTASPYVQTAEELAEARMIANRCVYPEHHRIDEMIANQKGKEWR
jgi:hypothetical protein